MVKNVFPIHTTRVIGIADWSYKQNADGTKLTLFADDILNFISLNENCYN